MIGQLAISKAGHDKGTLYVITAREEDFVYLCDGSLKKPDNPKKKRIRHIQPVNAAVEGELLRRLQGGGKVYAEEIKYALKQYASRQQAGAAGECGKQTGKLQGGIYGKK